MWSLPSATGLYFANGAPRGRFQAKFAAKCLILERRKNSGAPSRPPGARFATCRLLADDRRLHRPENTEQLAFFLFGNLELVQRLDQVLDQRIELCVGDAH